MNDKSARRVYLTLVGAAVISMVAIGGVLRTANRSILRHAPLVDAALEIKLELTTAHLWFEEAISGDRHKDIEDVWRNLDQADWYARTMLVGGKNRELAFVALDDPSSRELVRKVQGKLAEFRQITIERWQAKENSAIGSDIDQQYDAVFAEAIRMANEVEANIQRSITAETNRFHQLVILEILGSLVLFVFVAWTVRRHVVQLGLASQAVEAAALAKSEFLANMSHEIRTPMTAILGFTEVLQENLTCCSKCVEHGSCQVRQQNNTHIETISTNGEYLIGIINDILDLSKIEAGKLGVEHVQCSPCQVLSEVVSLMRVRAEAKNLSLEIEYDGPIPQTIQSDPTRLRQILINLTGNAVKFTEAGKVRLVARLLDAECDEPKMQFEVVDSGIGIAEEQIAKLFKPFSQAETSTTRRFGGTGLGLAISKRLAEKLGGDIAVKSIFGEGSTFIITVGTGPLGGVKLSDMPTESLLPTNPNKKPTAPKTKLDCRVLLAEDGPDNQRLIAFLLKKAGAEVAVAENGQIAHDKALAARDAGTPFDVILMDMQMPIMDGYDATAKIREAGYTCPIIALTAHAMSTDRDKCLAAGCDDYLTKPINSKKLISLVAEYASRQELHNAGDAPVA